MQCSVESSVELSGVMAMENKVLTGLTVVIFSVYMRTLSPNIAGEFRVDTVQ